MRLSDQQRFDWLRLIRSEGIGPRTFRALINRYGSAAVALEALPDLARQGGRLIVKIATVAEIEREMEKARRFGARFLASGEPDYPLPLAAIDTAPPMIAVRGRAEALTKPMVALVGSRNASALGLKFTEQLARDLGEAGYVVVSGLARGVDTVAHKASLRTGTIAVLAGGHDRIYPSQNAPLLDALLEQGVAISEMPFGWEPRGRDFPRRNRIVSGLALGTVVIEAARRSGSLITARFALEQGREVFAVPGSPLDPRAEGTNALLRDGATLCTAAEHVTSVLDPLIGKLPEGKGHLEERIEDDRAPLWDELDLPGLDLGGGAPHAPIGFHEGTAEERGDEPDWPDMSLPASEGNGMGPPPEQGAARSRILDLLGGAPTHVDDLARAAGMAVREVHPILLELELDGRIDRHPGGGISLVPPR